MRVRALATSLVLLGSAFLVPGTAEAAPQTHKDERIGYQIRVPKRWTQIPIQTDEQWIVAKYVPNKTDHYTDETIGFTFEHKQHLRVIAFIDELIDRQEAPEKEEEEEEGEEGEKHEGGDDETSSDPTIRLGKVYHDYLEYLKATFREGFYVSEEGEEKLGGRLVKQLTIKIDKAASAGDRLLLVWVYETEIGHVAVEFEVLEDERKKAKSTMAKTFKSFKEIKRTQPLAIRSAESTFFSLFEWGALDAADRAARRKRMEDKDWAQMTQDLPDGWTAQEIKNVCVLNRADEKYAKQLVSNIHAVRAWLEDMFPEVGAGEYARLPILRICKDRAERDSSAFFCCSAACDCRRCSSALSRAST